MSDSYDASTAVDANLQKMTFNIANDRRMLSDAQNFKLAQQPSNWLQGRQFEGQRRTVVVNVKNGDSPLDLTGVTVRFEGLKGDGHKVIDQQGGIILNATTGQFRFTFPYQAFAYFGAYKQAFFMLVRDNTIVGTLEFRFEVLVNLVEDGIVSTDYITPFMELYEKLEAYYEQGGSVVQKFIDAWTTKLQDLFTSLTMQGTSAANTLTQVQTTLSDLEVQIKQNNLVTQADFDDAMKPINDQANAVLKKVNDSLIVQTGGGFFDENKKLTTDLTSYGNQLDTSKFNLTVFTDLHYDPRDVYGSDYPSGGNSYPYGRYTLPAVQSILSGLSGKADVIHMNGDNINGLAGIESIKSQNRTVLNSWFSQSYAGSDVTATIGNHDDGSATGYWNLAANPNHILPLSWFKQNYQYPAGANQDETSMSFYKDYADKKIRYIVLDTEEPPLNKDVNGNLLYNRWFWHGFVQKTLDWLVNDALASVPVGYTTLIVTHCPIWYDSTDWSYEWYDRYAYAVNFNVLMGIINAFIGGGTYSITQTDADVNDYLNRTHNNSNPTETYGIGWGVTVNADFTNQGKRDFAGMFSGHTHQEAIANFGTFKNVQLQHGFATQASDIGTDKQIGLTTISIDTINRKVNLFGFGQATNRSFGY